MNIISGIGESGFLANSAFSAGIATKDSNGNDITATYLTGVDLTPYQTTADMVNYQTTAGMTAYQEAGEYYSASNPSGFLVADDITGKLDASVYAADSGNFLTAVPDTYLQNTDLSTEDGKVTAISGIPLSAGGDVPEGVMVESGLEYNAVNEISGYNGSAIAQYGAEKQWLVHDDTLVHAANSAQYALGVNLSAVAQLLGVDETVLFEGSSANPTLSESINNFKKVDIVYTYWSDKYTTRTLYGWSANPTFTEGWYNEGGTFGGIFITRLTANDSYTVIGSDSNRYWNPPTGTTLNDATSNFKILKVIGIGRKA